MKCNRKNETIDLKTQSCATNNRNCIYHLHTFRFIQLHVFCLHFHRLHQFFSHLSKKKFNTIFWCFSLFASSFYRIIIGLWRKQSLRSKANKICYFCTCDFKENISIKRKSSSWRDSICSLHWTYFPWYSHTSKLYLYIEVRSFLWKMALLFRYSKHLYIQTYDREKKPSYQNWTMRIFDGATFRVNFDFSYSISIFLARVIFCSKVNIDFFFVFLLSYHYEFTFYYSW